jgi:acyl transferase domain-containing protein/enoyl-CoA hydratase/carnithine racemase/acyl carrier protein
MSIKDDDVAVIGMSGRFPGANSVAEFWQNICAKKESIRALSDEELRIAGVAERDIADRSYVKACAPLDDIDRFDAGFFRISPLEAEMMDPQIRLLLQCAWETLEDAGHARKEAQNIGVFAGGGGVTNSYFSSFVNVNDRFERITASPTHLGNDKDFLATSISYKLNLTGPSVTVQTACSTSLVALHQARSSLLSGECDMALAGGVTVHVPHGRGYHYKEGYVFSKSGRIQTFDRNADGVVFGSALGLVLIRKLSDAIRDGDNIYAVIKGSAIANDGKGKMSYAASSARGQIACARAALKNAAVDPAGIGFVECHGTGTAMGDPEEVKALSAVFKEHTDKRACCALGAVKTNVGHSEAAAGIVGFIKAVLAVKHGLIPPTLHYATPNPRIKFENTPFYVNGELQKWDEGERPRMAAVNSLGVGGTNAFVVLEEYVPANRSTKNPDGPFVVPLSAKTGSSLHAYAQRLADFVAPVASGKLTADLAEIAYTLQTGREAMDRRVAFVVSTIPELRASLDGYLQGVEPGTPPGEAANLAAAWAAGADVDWLKLYADGNPRRTSLPTYVFAKDRHWVDTGSVTPSRAVIHPLLHTNTSDLNEQKYSATFTGDEFFLKDHQVRTKERTDQASQLQKVLPGAAYLEMARAAIEQAAPIRQGASVLELRNVVWLQPIVVSEDKQVSIALLARDPAGQPDQRIDFEVYTRDDHIHCQGRCSFSSEEAAPDRLDAAKLKASMRRGRWSAEAIYAAFARMGLDYGPAHRSIAAIETGDRQLLAHLMLPQALAAGQQDYVLHPSLMDGALQAATALLFDPHNVPCHPIVPFALETLRLVAPCKPQMYVWARFSQGSHPCDRAARLDIELLDAEGNVCVQIRGFTPRSLGNETLGGLLATQEWEASNPVGDHSSPAEQHVIVCDLPQVDAQKIARDGSLLQLDPGKSAAERYGDLALACFERAQALVNGKPQGNTLLQVVLPNTAEHAVYAGLAGLFKTVRLENPQIAGQVVFVDAGVGTDELAKLLQAERGRLHDTLIKYEHGVRHVTNWRFLQADAARAFDDDGPFKDQGVYVITGGLGGLGVLFANEILARTLNATIVLTGRASPADLGKSASKNAILESLQAGGAKVEYRQLDLEDPNQVEQLIAAVRGKYKRLNGVIHCAGTTSDSFILKKTADEFRRVLAPKTIGTHHLDVATRDVDLDFLVLFSSLTSAVGNLGQADYAAANGFMDAFAAHRNRLVKAGKRRGLTLAIRWPLWRDGGMQPDAAGRDMLHETTGTYPMQTATGMRMFYRSLALGCDQTLVMEGDLPLMQRTLGVGAALHAAGHEFEVPKLEASPEGDLAERTENYLSKQLAVLLKLAAGKVDPRAALEDYGIDSILALELTRLLEKTFGALPKTLFFEYLTIRELAGYFAKAHTAALSRLFSGPDSGAMQKPDRAPSPAEHQCISIRSSGRRFADGAAGDAYRQQFVAADPIAIVGLSGRYPESRDLQAFWRHLRDGKDCIVEVPRDRWDWREYYSEDRAEKGRHYSKWGGFIEGVDEFDARFFNISPAEAATIDPQERLFLQHAWMAMEDAGYTRAALQIPREKDLPGQVGVYAGVMYGEYQLFGAEASLQGNRMGFASNLASIANRVSYALNLHGPSMAVDTMCSSSLTAIHLACQDLKLGRTSLALAGGVNVTIHPNKYLMLSAGQFISGDGHCQSFGEGGDGYIPGEGVGVVVLKRLSEAERDGNHVYGVIKGSALSHGGKTNGYTVPNPQAQASAIRQALADARVDPRHISYIEAHGTGTRLGDPIEIAALSKVFRESTQDTGFCLIGSAKSNIGHAEAAAGIAGLTKVLLQLKHRHIVPSLHSSRLNPHIDFGSSPLVVNQTLTPWEQPVVDGRRLPRIAGVSSFGAGGSNAHLIVQEYSPPIAAAHCADGVEYIVPLSARTAEQLRQKARDLVDFVRGEIEPLSIASLAYTLQVGREAMDERLAVLADSVAALTGKLQAYLDGQAADGLYAGQVKANKDAMLLFTQDADLNATIRKWVAGRQHSKLADLWARGLELDWDEFHPAKPALISLPTYPFARQRFWIDAAVAARRAPKVPATTVLHPLLHRNTSDFDQQSYATAFDPDEFFLEGEPGQRCLTEAACLEMARAAVELAMPSRKESSILELRDVAWARPGVAVGDSPVTTALFDKAGEQVAFEIYSADGGTPFVHCQGRARYSDSPAPAKLDLAGIAAQGGQALTQLCLPSALEDGHDAFVLHPALVQNALKEATSLAGGRSHPLAMASLRIVSPSTPAKLAWTRPSASTERTIDVDLCDEQGQVGVQIRGLRYALPMSGVAETPAARPTPVRVDTSPSIDPDVPILEKPNRSIALKAPAASTAVCSEPTPWRKPRVSLSARTSEVATPKPPRAASSAALFDHGNGVFAIRVDAPASGNALSADVVQDLLRAMRTVEHAPSAKVLILEGGDARFLTGGAAQHRDARASKLYRAIVEFPYPVIAVVRGDAVGAGFLVAAVSDFMVCSDSARYAFALPHDGLYPSAAEGLLIERFGRVHATDFLWLAASATGAELKQKGWTCPILPRDRVALFAQHLAANLAMKSQASLRLLKQQLARRIAAAVQDLPAADEGAFTAQDEKPVAIESASGRLELKAHGDHALVVTIRRQGAQYSANELLADLEAVFARIDEASSCRCVVLASELAGFLPEVPAEACPQVAQGYHRALLALRRPVVAALNGNADGIAWYVAQLCDACVYSKEGRYSCADVLRDPALAGEAAAAFSLRLGDESTKHLLLVGAEASGAELHGDYGALHVVGAHQVLDSALALADALAACPMPVLSAWKRRTAFVLQARATVLGDEPVPTGEGARGTRAVEAPVALALESKVISAIAHPEGILEVRMADRDAKNMFSDAFSRGMREVFAHVEESRAYKVVVLTGYDSYFSSGGTQDTLLAIHEGKARFTDNTVFQLPLSCPVPVIAAMQGHGIGAGWAMGMYADFALFSDESRYFSPYMGYGFTPGAGSTLLFPEKIGYDLARETLLTAQEYSGGDLKERGLRNPVLPRDQVLPAAMALARRIAQGPRGHLAALKRRWAEPLRNALQGTFDHELAMHSRTFVGQADTLARIQQRFRTQAAPATQGASLPQPLPRPGGAQDLGALAASLRKLLADELRMQEHEIDPDEQFVDLGLDSITGVTWIRRINEKYGTSIEAIKVYSYPTLGQLTGYVREEAQKAGTFVAAPPADVLMPAAPVDVPIAGVQAPPAAQASAISLTSWRRERRPKSVGTGPALGLQPIAVIGMAGQFAKAGNLEEFWQNIAQGRDCIEEIPKHRWDIDLYYQEGEIAPGKTYSKWMGALDEYDLFDAAFFNISPREAKSMDPQQRLFLQACWHGIEHAGYDRKALAGTRCGVFVGCSAGDYHQLSKREQLSGQGFTGAAASMLAARISYFLDLQGPSLSIDTACSSSLVAIATACDSLVCGNSDIALAGGVNVMAGPAMQIMTAQVGMLSPQGRCFTFDEKANGIANGEGVGVVMLKRLADAERDRDRIYGVVEGWGVNQDGRTNGITAPNADSQTRLQQEVYDKFRIDPAGIQLVEAHGTGTALGDPIEVAGLKASFGKYTRNENYCALGSVKSNIGHCLTAAGVSGFLKILLALKHEQLPPTIHFSTLNKHISLQASPFYISDRLRAWPRDGAQARRAAVNSFGFSGTNAHVVIAEYRGEQESAARDEPAIVPISAKTADQLERKAQDLLTFLRGERAVPLDLRRIAHTLQVGREPMNERAAFVVRTVAELEHGLQAFIDRKDVEGLYRGQASGGKGTLAALSADPDFQVMVAKWIARKELPRLADLWVKGMALDWTAFHADAIAPRRMGLPGYPFARERHWIDAMPEEHGPGPALQPSVSLASCVPLAPPVSLTPPVPDPQVRPSAAKTSTQPTISLPQLQNELRASLAEALFMKPSDVDARKSFTELGLDSIIGVEWIKTVNKRYGTEIAATRVYDYPTVTGLAAFLHAQIAALGIDVVETAESPEPFSPPAPQAVAPPRIRRETIRQQLKASLAEALFMKPSDVDVNKSFTELGLDSIVGVEWVKAINKQYGTGISATRVYDYPSVEQLASHLAAETAVTVPGAGGIRFEPKHAQSFKSLYFYSAEGEGDFEIEGELSVRYAISPDTNVCLKEHVVFGEHLLPTDAYVELVYCAYRTYFSSADVRLKNIAIVNPILGARGRDTHVKVVFRRAGEELQFFVKSSWSQDFSNDKLHMQGFIALARSTPPGRFDEGFAVQKTLDRAEIPTNAGTYYSPLQSLRFGESSALGTIRVADHDFGFLANPFALYGGLCTVINYGGYLAARDYGASGSDEFLPYRIGEIAVLGPLLGSDYRCYAEVRALERDSIELYFEIVDSAARPVVVVDSIVLRRVAGKTLQQQARAAEERPVVQTGRSSNDRGVAVEKVAIIGMSCRYPMSENVDAFWENLKAGRDCVTEVPAGRWSAHADWYHPDPRHPHTSYSKWGGFLGSIEHFDALFFGISPAEAELIDPQQRIFLEECWKTIESAGYAPGALSNRACGVYVGCATGDYARVLAGDGQDTAGAAFMGMSNAILAARISYCLNLKGPALALDTACSSSLVAVHLACESIRSGENELALAGGINLLATPIGHILTSQVGMPSRDGRCAAFDASANGIVFSEGCGVLLLKALSAAQRDNDNILGVIQGSGTNQDGKTNGITAPSAIAQEQLLRQVYARFDIDPKRISYVEAHGTATPLGDPIEVNALTAVFGNAVNGGNTCALGSVKSNIGHTGFAAGVAGIVKVLLCMKHRQLVPSIHYSQPNPHIDFEKSPFHVNTDHRDWASDGPRLAAVSSFGFSGTNAHVVIEEHLRGDEPVHADFSPRHKAFVPLSAKTAEQLQQKVRDLLDFISRHEQPLDLVRLAYTLQAGRDAMDHRLAMIVGSVAELADKLQSCLDGKAHLEDVYRGQASFGDDTLAMFAADEEMRQVMERWVAQKNLRKVADLWVKGFELDLNTLCDGARPRRMTLPTYPFARERCWVERTPGSASRQRAAIAAPSGTEAIAVLHPLVHRNTSELGQQRYTSTFAGDEFFLADHRVNEQRVLPAVAYLEMARAALLDAMPAEQSSPCVELRHVAWSQPIIVGEAKSVSIAVFSDHDGQLGFEVYSDDEGGGDEVLHCQGGCVVGERPEMPRLDLDGLRTQMQRPALDGGVLYPLFATLGLQYGPAFQGIVTVHQSEHQLLIELKLPEAAYRGAGDYVLHPSLMDSALQGSIPLINNAAEAAGKPTLPFALESLRILSACTERMVAWVRYSQGARDASPGLTKVDIDLCDTTGKVCVQMHGFSSRPMEDAAPFDEAHYESVIAGILSNEISADQAVELD